ncbi:hypothetical protein HDU96_005680, partial [Phlyctochytrium bullatum]
RHTKNQALSARASGCQEDSDERKAILDGLVEQTEEVKLKKNKVKDEKKKEEDKREINGNKIRDAAVSRFKDNPGKDQGGKQQGQQGRCEDGRRGGSKGGGKRRVSGGKAEEAELSFFLGRITQSLEGKDEVSEVERDLKRSKLELEERRFEEERADWQAQLQLNMANAEMMRCLAEKLFSNS